MGRESEVGRTSGLGRGKRDIVDERGAGWRRSTPGVQIGKPRATSRWMAKRIGLVGGIKDERPRFEGITTELSNAKLCATSSLGFLSLLSVTLSDPAVVVLIGYLTYLA